MCPILYREIARPQETEVIVAEDSQPDDLVEFTVEDQLELLRSNTLALAAGTISFLRTQGIPATEWTAYLGEIFARGWDTDEPWSAEDFSNQRSSAWVPSAERQFRRNMAMTTPARSSPDFLISSVLVAWVSKTLKRISSST